MENAFCRPTIRSATLAVGPHGEDEDANPRCNREANEGAAKLECTGGRIFEEREPLWTYPVVSLEQVIQEIGHRGRSPGVQVEISRAEGPMGTYPATPRITASASQYRRDDLGHRRGRSVRWDATPPATRGRRAKPSRNTGLWSLAVSSVVSVDSFLIATALPRGHVVLCPSMPQGRRQCAPCSWQRR